MSGEGRRGGCGFGGKVAFGREEKENRKGFGFWVEEERTQWVLMMSL